MTKLTAHLFHAGRLTLIAAAGSLSLHAGLAHAETYTFTADGLFSTGVISFSLGVDNTSGHVDNLHLVLPINASTPELFKLDTGGEIFDATLIAASPTEILTYDFNRALVSSVTPRGDSGRISADVSFATSTFSLRPTPMAAPEIDPASAVSGVFLLAGGLAVLRGRRAGASEPTAASWQRPERFSRVRR